jgi:hypothetical protein
VRDMIFRLVGAIGPGGRAYLVGDRRQFLTTMSSDVIRAVKLAALEDGMNAWEIMEEAVKEWLARRKKSRRKA